MWPTRRWLRSIKPDIGACFPLASKTERNLEGELLERHRQVNACHADSIIHIQTHRRKVEDAQNARVDQRIGDGLSGWSRYGDDAELDSPLRNQHRQV